MNDRPLEATLHPNQVAAMVGTGLAAGAVVASGLMVFLLYAVAFEAAHLRAWSLAALLGALVVLAACAFQWVAWTRWLIELRGNTAARLAAWERPSWWAHVASYPALLLAVVACAWVAAHSPFDSVLFWLSAVALLGVAVGQATAATQFLRPDGPPGTVPAHVRRWVARSNARADAAEAGEGVSAG